jgi:hypothetical protein
MVYKPIYVNLISLPQTTKCPQHISCCGHFALEGGVSENQKRKNIVVLSSLSIQPYQIIFYYVYKLFG